MAYIVSSIPPFYSNNTSAPSTFYPPYISPFYPSYTTYTAPSPNHFYLSEVTTPNLSTSYYNYGSEGYSSYRSNYPIFDDKEDAYGWVLCIEKHFKENGTPEAMKLPEAVLALSGLPRQWYFWWSQNHPSASWEVFVAAFIWRFKPEFRDVLPILDHEEEPTSFENYADISEKDFAINSKPPQPTNVTPCPFPSSPPPPPKPLIVASFPFSPSPPQQQSDHNLFSPPPQLPLDEPEPEKEKIDEEESEEKTEPEGQTEALPCAPPPPPPKPPDFDTLTESSGPALPPKPPDPCGPQSPTKFQSTPSRLPSLKPLKPPDRVSLPAPLLSPKPPDIASIRCIPSLNKILLFSSPPKSLDLKFDDVIRECMFEQPHKVHTEPSDFLHLEFHNQKRLEPSDHIFLDAAQSYPLDKSTICVLGKEPLMNSHVSHKKSLDVSHVLSFFAHIKKQPFPLIQCYSERQLYTLEANSNSLCYPDNNPILLSHVLLIDVHVPTAPHEAHHYRTTSTLLPVCSQNNPSAIIQYPTIQNSTFLVPFIPPFDMRDSLPILWPSITSNISSFQQPAQWGFSFLHSSSALISGLCSSIRFKSTQLISSIQGWDPGRKILVFKVANCSQLKQWDPGGYFDLSTLICFSQFRHWECGKNFFPTRSSSSLQFKKWDPGKFVVKSIFLQP